MKPISRLMGCGMTTPRLAHELTVMASRLAHRGDDRPFRRYEGKAMGLCHVPIGDMAPVYVQPIQEMTIGFQRDLDSTIGKIQHER